MVPAYRYMLIAICLLAIGQPAVSQILPKYSTIHWKNNNRDETAAAENRPLPLLQLPLSLSISSPLMSPIEENSVTFRLTVLPSLSDKPIDAALIRGSESVGGAVGGDVQLLSLLESVIYRGEELISQGKLSEAESLFKEAISNVAEWLNTEGSKSVHLNRLMTGRLTRLSVALYSQSLYREALNALSLSVLCFDRATRGRETSVDVIRRAKLVSNMGSVAMLNANFPVAIVYFNDVLERLTGQIDEFDLSSAILLGKTYTRLGAAYLAIDDVPQAVSHFSRGAAVLRCVYEPVAMQQASGLSDYASSLRLLFADYMPISMPTDMDMDMPLMSSAVPPCVCDGLAAGGRVSPLTDTPCLCDCSNTRTDTHTDTRTDTHTDTRTDTHIDKHTGYWVTDRLYDIIAGLMAFIATGSCLLALFPANTDLGGITTTFKPIATVCNAAPPPPRTPTSAAAQARAVAPAAAAVVSEIEHSEPEQAQPSLSPSLPSLPSLPPEEQAVYSAIEGRALGRLRAGAYRQAEAGLSLAIRQHFPDSDAIAIDANAIDANAIEANAIDANAIDAIASDAIASDAIASDAIAIDANAIDANAIDANAIDANAIDAIADDANADDADVYANAHECIAAAACHGDGGIGAENTTPTTPTTTTPTTPTTTTTTTTTGSIVPLGIVESRLRYLLSKALIALERYQEGEKELYKSIDIYIKLGVLDDVAVAALLDYSLLVIRDQLYDEDGEEKYTPDRFVRAHNVFCSLLFGPNSISTSKSLSFQRFQICGPVDEESVQAYGLMSPACRGLDLEPSMDIDIDMDIDMSMDMSMTRARELHLHLPLGSPMFKTTPIRASSAAAAAGQEEVGEGGGGRGEVVVFNAVSASKAVTVLAFSPERGQGQGQGQRQGLEQDQGQGIDNRLRSLEKKLFRSSQDVWEENGTSEVEDLVAAMDMCLNSDSYIGCTEDDYYNVYTKSNTSSNIISSGSSGIKSGSSSGSGITSSLDGDTVPRLVVRVLGGIDESRDLFTSTAPTATAAATADPNALSDRPKLGQSGQCPGTCPGTCPSTCPSTCPGTCPTVIGNTTRGTPLTGYTGASEGEDVYDLYECSYDASDTFDALLLDEGEGDVSRIGMVNLYEHMKENTENNHTTSNTSTNNINTNNISTSNTSCCNTTNCNTTIDNTGNDTTNTNTANDNSAMQCWGTESRKTFSPYVEK
jgi:hypothetical protein